MLAYSHPSLPRHSEPANQPSSPRQLLVFQISGQFAAFPLEHVERVTSMAELSRPPGLPAALEGFLDLAGVAIPVVRPDRLFELPAQQLGLYSMLIILRVPQGIAILVDRVSEVLSVPASEFLPVDQGETFNGCTEATLTQGKRNIHILSSARLLLAKEKASLGQFQTLAQRRLQNWETDRS